MEIALKEGLIEILKIAGKNPILIECRNNVLYVGTYTDYHKFIYESPVQYENFSVVISADIAKDLPDMIFGTMKVGEGFLQFSDNKNNIKISLSEDDISLKKLARGFVKENVASFVGSDFRNAFNYTRHASNDKSIGDVVLRGFHFLIKTDSSEVMASNGSMLSLVNINQTSPEFNSSELLLLNSDFIRLLKLFGDEEVFVGFNENSVSVFQEKENYTIRAITARTSGKDLPYQSVIDSTKDSVLYHYVVDKAEFSRLIKQLKVFSEERSSLTFYSTGEFTVSSSGKSGESSFEVPVLSHGDFPENNIEIKMNVSNLHSYLNASRSDTVKISIKDELSPMLLEDSFGLEILAPLRK